MKLLPARVSGRRFLRDLQKEIVDDSVLNGAAALAYYLTLAVFPALIFFLSLLPYLPIAEIDHAILDLIRQGLPPDAADLITSVLRNVMKHRQGGLLSFGLVAALWAASAGMYAIMQQLNLTYDVEDSRPYLRARLIALALTAMVGSLMIGSLALVVLGGKIQAWLAGSLGWSKALLICFRVLRWVIIIAALLLAFSVIYYFGPDVEQRFRFVTPGSAFGTVATVLACVAFRVYTSNFGHYDATYGSIGAVIVFMLWLYIVGLVMLVGSEINALLEHYSPEGKHKGQKREPPRARRGLRLHPA